MDVRRSMREGVRMGAKAMQERECVERTWNNSAKTNE